jgi:hypothetical protein
VVFQTTQEQINALWLDWHWYANREGYSSPNTRHAYASYQRAMRGCKRTYRNTA